MSKLNLPVFSRKKLLLLGFLFVSILAIPATVYLVKQQQDQRSQAIATTTLSFTPSAQTAEIGDQVPFSIWVDPGNNQVSVVKLVITYDSSLISITENDFVINPLSNFTVNQGPVVNDGEFSVILHVGSDPTKVLQTNTELATLTFTVNDPSDTPTQITFDPNKTQISSIAAPDSFTENVFLSGTPATITILDEVILTPTPIATLSGTLTPTLTQDPTLTIEPTITTETPTPTVIGGEIPTPITNAAPVCSSLFADLGTSGVAPFTLIFKADGSDADGTISKVTFDFGDGAGETISEGIEFGLSTFSIQKSHTYTTAGTYTTTVVLTDDSNTVSSSAECSLEITVTDSEGGVGTIDTSTPVPTIVAPGPADAIVGVGIIGGVLFLIGTLLFFAL